MSRTSQVLLWELDLRLGSAFTCNGYAACLNRGTDSRDRFRSPRGDKLVKYNKPWVVKHCVWRAGTLFRVVGKQHHQEYNVHARINYDWSTTKMKAAAAVIVRD